jgi:diguanylate cyclase (GGDEF)-like protein
MTPIGTGSAPPGKEGGSPLPASRGLWRLVSDRLIGGRSQWLFQAIFVLTFVLPTLALMVVSIAHYREDATSTAMEAKELQGRLAATIVTEKLAAQFDLASSFATRPLLVRNVEQGHWQEAMRVLDGVPGQYGHIDRIVLYDPAGVVKADLPATGLVGQDRADKGWYGEFSKRQQPYLSGVYLRASEPRTYVVGLVLPVVGAPTAEKAHVSGGDLIAILQVQLNLREFYDWTAADVGRKGLIYIVDQYGHLVHHSRRRDTNALVDFSTVDIVRKALAGQSGVELNYNPLEGETRLAAYRALPEYGWGVVVTQAAEEAFADRERILRTYYSTYAGLALLSLLLALAILRMVTMQRAAEEQQKNLALLDELTGLHNRRGFITLSLQQLTAANRLNQNLFFIYIDLNGMKPINDAFGHQEGDRAIMDTADVLRSTFRDIDIKARIGGDEFVVLGIVAGGFDPEIIRERLRKAVASFMADNPRPYELSFSTGIVIYDPEHPCSLEELMARADRLMYEAKLRRPEPVNRLRSLRGHRNVT